MNRKIVDLTPFLLSVPFFFVCLFTSLACAQAKEPSLIEKREAGKAWEALIRMKGGAEKLHSITNFLEQSDNYVELQIFPNSSWSFGYAPVSDSPMVNILDGAKSVEYYVGAKGLNTSNPATSRVWIAYAVIPFLLETKWDRPTPVRVTSIVQSKKKLDIIETIVEGKRLDFVYEPEEMLVTEVRYYNSKGEWSHSYAFSNYADVNGIKMAQKWAPRYSDDLKIEKIHYIPITFTFNVDYDPKIFEPPFKATTSDAWKRKS